MNVAPFHGHCPPEASLLAARTVTGPLLDPPVSLRPARASAFRCWSRCPALVLALPQPAAFSGSPSLCKLRTLSFSFPAQAASLFSSPPPAQVPPSGAAFISRAQQPHPIHSQRIMTQSTLVSFLYSSPSQPARRGSRKTRCPQEVRKGRLFLTAGRESLSEVLMIQSPGRPAPQGVLLRAGMHPQMTLHPIGLFILA